MTKNNSLVETAGSSKKARVRGIALVATAMLLVGGGGAFAYWTSNGNGTGSAKNALGNGTLVLTAAFAPGLTPGASEPVTFTATNPGTSSVNLATITSVVTTDAAGCLPADFTIAPVTFNTKLAGTPKSVTPAVVTLSPTGTLTFTDTAINQDACKDATVTLTLTSTSN